ncbi:MAG: recombinase family protein [Bacillus sp. (in: firmicutes)]
MNLAFGYIRRSSYKQQENNSLELQKSHIKEYAQRNNFTVPDEFMIIEDVTSAFSKRANQRKELMRLKNMMIETKVPRVIFYEESRMDRTGYTFVLDFYRPLQAIFPEVEVYTTNETEPFNPNNPRTQIALLLFRQESEIKSERAVARLLADLGDDDIIRPGAKVPYGYNQVNKKLVPNEKGEIVSFIYFLQSWGTSMGKIASILNNASIPAPQGGIWRSSTVENILKNPVYTGKVVWTIHKGKSKKPHELIDRHEPLIDTFLLQLNENNIKLQNEFGRLDTPFLFLNKLSCRHCHEKLVTQNGSTTRKGKKYFYQYYVCKNCNYKIDINDVHEKLQTRILNHIHQLYNNEETQSNTMSYLLKLDQSIKENIVKTEEHIDKIAFANEQSDRELQEFIDTLNNKYIAILKDLIRSQHTVQELMEGVESGLFFERFKQVLQLQLGDAEKRLMNLYFIDQILISPDKPFQINYRNNVFESFILPTSGQSTEHK